MNNTTISGNDAGIGGGFYSYLSSTLTMNNCTISGNSASSGGGFYFLYGTGTINNSTISGNMATGQGGGIWGFYENVTINNATITDNTAPRGGGIFRYFPTNGMVLNRSIISGNHASSGGPEVYAQNGPWNINNYNVVGYGGSTRSYSLTIGSTDVIPSGALNSLLNPTLSSNGGPTLTHALVSGSVAMDLAPTTACTNAPISGLDQRGAVRVFDGDGTPSSNECDSGAVEMRETITVGTCGGTALSGSYDFTFLTGNTITIDILNGNGLTCLSIEETGPGVNHPLATGPGPSGVGLLTGNWWHIRGDVNTGLNVEVTLPYTSANSDSRVCKWPGGLGGAGWDCGPLDGTGTNFIGNTSVTRSNLSSFSDWAVGQKVGPTAVSLEQVTVSTEKRGGFLAGLISVMGFALYTVSLRRKKQSSN
ncbi:MAG: hypothetical protein HUU38_16065 [Anaerolineales bacterium]|nr:hypothetical protein [Anaerolineales bacterium]